MTYIEELQKKSSEILLQRAEQRGHHSKLYRLLAQRWSQHVGVPVSESTVCLMLSDMKIAREIAGKNDEDNIVDLVNYAYLYADLAYKSDDDHVIIDTLSRLNKGD